MSPTRMERRQFSLRDLEALIKYATAKAVLPASAPTIANRQHVEASLYGYVRCPHCGAPMLRTGHDTLECCGHVYKEPTILLEVIE